MDDRNVSDANRLWFRMLRLQTRMNLAMAERLKPFNLSIPQCDVLSTLTEREGVSQQELAKRLYVTKGNISGLLDRLAAANLVERRSIESDRRSHAIYLTPNGRRLAEQAIAAQREFVTGTLGRLSSQQINQLETLLITARDLVRENSDAPGAQAPREAAVLRIGAGRIAAR